jgi:hypothetical protein
MTLELRLEGPAPTETIRSGVRFESASGALLETVPIDDPGPTDATRHVTVRSSTDASPGFRCDIG